MPKRVINAHEDADHVWGNQLFQGAEIIAWSAPEWMKHVANPQESQKLRLAFSRSKSHHSALPQISPPCLRRSIPCDSPISSWPALGGI